jgi:hypothetical protein
MEVLKTGGRSKKITRNYSCVEHISFWFKRIMLLYKTKNYICYKIQGVSLAIGPKVCLITFKVIDVI